MLHPNELAALFLRGNGAWNETFVRPDNQKQEIDLRQLKFDPNGNVKLAGSYLFPGPVRFEGVVFPDDFCIQDCSFQSTVSFQNATLGKNFVFQAVTFKENFNIESEEFTNELRFKGCRFEKGVNFTHARFENGVDLTGCAFLESANFNHAAFGQPTLFTSSNFACRPSFDGAEFKGDANFIALSITQGIQFHVKDVAGHCRFNDAAFGGKCDFEGAHFRKDVDFSKKGESTQATFGEMLFTGTTFGGVAYFNKREFPTRTSFRDARFEKPPEFFETAINQNTDWEGSKFNGLEQPDAERCFRTLKLAMSSHQAHSDELVFFANEMKARRLKEKRWTVQWLYGAYESWSDYGQSIKRPAWWLLGVGVGSFLLYVCLHAYWLASSCSAANACHLVFDARNAGKLFSFAVAQSLPFIRDPIGGMMDFLPQGGRLSLAVRGIAFVQALFSLVLLFLVGLGLRNLFRLK